MASNKGLLGRCIVFMKPAFDEYRDMVNGLAESGFTPEQAEGLVRLLDQVFTRQEAFHERISQQLAEELADFREEIADFRKEIREEVREIRRWNMMTLTALVLLVLGSLMNAVF